jgi:hypothetical protein
MPRPECQKAGTDAQACHAEPFACHSDPTVAGEESSQLPQGKLREASPQFVAERPSQKQLQGSFAPTGRDSE